MKTKFLVLIAAVIIISSSFVYLHDQMYDCLNPPLWMKIPYFGLEKCFQLLFNGNLPDWTQAREDYAKKQALRIKLIESFNNTPEVSAFYAKHDDAKVSVKDDHVLYFAGNEDNTFVRMKFYFDKNYGLDYIDFHCFVKGEFQHDVAQEDILHYLENKECLVK